MNFTGTCICAPAHAPVTSQVLHLKHSISAVFVGLLFSIILNNWWCKMIITGQKHDSNWGRRWTRIEWTFRRKTRCLEVWATVLAAAVEPLWIWLHQVSRELVGHDLTICSWKSLVYLLTQTLPPPFRVPVQLWHRVIKWLIMDLKNNIYW